MERISSNASQPRIIAEIEKLSAHDDRGVRLKIVDVARDCNRYHTKYRIILRTMTEDLDAEVASMAGVELARFGEKIKPAVIERIKNYLLSAKGMSSPRLPSCMQSLPWVLMESRFTAHSAWQFKNPNCCMARFLNLSNGWRNPKEWTTALKDRDQG